MGFVDSSPRGSSSTSALGADRSGDARDVVVVRFLEDALVKEVLLKVEGVAVTVGVVAAFLGVALIVDASLSSLSKLLLRPLAVDCV